MKINRKARYIAFWALGIFATYLFWQDFPREARPVKISGAYEALNLWSAQRAYPGAVIPDVGHFAAYARARQRFHKASVAVQHVEPWAEMGPHNMGGRTLAIAFNPLNPNTIYAGSASGGLWRSYSSGRGADAWDRVATGFPLLAVSTIAIQPDDSNTIYIGTGEVYNYQSAGTGAAFRSTRGTYGIGILKTTDGGVTWQKSLDWTHNQMRGVWAIKIDPSDPNVVWAATTEGTWKSTDAGATWSQVHGVIMAMDVVIDPLNPNNVVVGCGNFASAGYGLYRTADGGATWMKISAGVPAVFNGKIQLAVKPVLFSTHIYASIGNGFSGPDGATWLCRSTDSGATWEIINTQDYSQWQGWFAHDVAVHPAPSLLDEMMAGGIQVHKSTDGGTSFVQKSSGGAFGGPIPPGAPEGPDNYVHADVHDIQYHPTDPDMVYFATDGGVFRSRDRGETFEACNGGYQTSQFYNGFSSSTVDTNLAMGGLQDNGTIIYTGSPTWIRFVIGGDGGWTAMHRTDRNVMYGSWQFLNLLKSTNGGTTFFNTPVPGQNRITVFIAPFVIGVDNPAVIYAARDIVYKSTNGGNTWSATNGGSPLDSNPVLALAISPQTSEVVYAASAPFINRPGVFRSVNGGAVWTNITGDLPNRFPTDIAVHPGDPGTAYLTFSGFGSSHLFKTGDFGDTWADAGAGLPDVPANAVAIDPLYTDHLYVGNDLGVYFSPDGGQAWEAFSDGLPEAVIATSLAISPENRKLWVATHGNGAYQRGLLSPPTSIEEPATAPQQFLLSQNYPNPFNPETTIPFALSQPAGVTLKIYNARGQEVRTLLNNASKSAGQHRVTWDGRDNRGQIVASGVYVYRLSAQGVVQSRRMVLAR